MLLFLDIPSLTITYYRAWHICHLLLYSPSSENLRQHQLPSQPSWLLNLQTALLLSISSYYVFFSIRYQRHAINGGGVRGGAWSRQATGQLARDCQPAYADSQWWLGDHSLPVRESSRAGQVEGLGWADCAGLVQGKLRRRMNKEKRWKTTKEVRIIMTLGLPSC